MGSTSNRRTGKAAAAEPAGRVLTPEQKRELTIDTMASWALDGLHPPARQSRTSTRSWPAGSRRVNTSRS
jgi:hypothetical protein